MIQSFPLSLESSYLPFQQDPEKIKIISGVGLELQSMLYVNRNRERRKKH